MKREDFIATVGYSGNSAIVDGKAKRRYGKLSVAELIERGLFRPACCAAIYDGNESAFALILEKYNASHGTRYESIDELKHVFGVDSVPEDVTHVKVL